MNKMWKGTQPKKRKYKSEGLCGEPGKLPFEFLKDITNNFAAERKLGSGASGEVYKGVFEDGRVIAIKKLHSFMSSTDDKQFQNEFDHLKRLKHQNIVQLVGFCDEEVGVCVPFEGKMVHAVEIHRALCLEFVPNGGLGNFLSGKGPELNWHTRFKIIQGTCHGLKYLHELLIMHFDLKLDNILLDEKMMPKIADFGLSRLLGEENTVMTKTALGTIGYLPPEFINKQVISKKYDIFSLGVIIKRIVSGMDYWNISQMDGRQCIEHVHNSWRERMQEMSTYASLIVDCKQVRTCMEIAVDCMEEDPHKRPSMNNIVCRLSQVEKDSKLQDGHFFLPVREKPSSEHESEDNFLDSRFDKFSCSFAFLRLITNDFSMERIVSEPDTFKGILFSGKEIAVKRFGDGSFTYLIVHKYKYAYLMETEHENILGLIGYCSGQKKKVAVHDARYILRDEAASYICQEYAQRGSLDKYIYGESGQLDWNVRFKIIMGICEGLHFLHAELREPISDTPLSPEYILLDANMVPKLTNVGLSRHLNSIAMGFKPFTYIAPEISLQTDIYNLGLLIIQIVTGEENRPSPLTHFGEELICKVRDRKDGYFESRYPSLDTTSIGQLELCIQTGLRCTELDKVERPSIQEIVKTLKSTYVGPVLKEDITSSSTASQYRIVSSLRCEFQNQSLHVMTVQPQQLCFPLQPTRLASRFLYLINKANKRVAFRLVAKTPRRYHTKLPLCGIVPPKCTYTLAVTIREQKKKALNEEEFLILQCSIAFEDDLKSVDPASIVVFFEKAKEKTGNQVQEMMLPVIVYDPPKEVTAHDQSIQFAEIVASQNHRQVLSVDVHPKEPWILTSNHGGGVYIWDYQKQEMVNSFKISTDEPVYSAKFIERKHWFVTGDGDGYIHVYSYDTMQEVSSFEAHENHVMSLAVNPTFSFMLSASDDHLIKLWDWNKGWECIRTFEGHYNRVTQVMFHPKDSVNFASASLDRRVKIWNIFTGTCNITFDEQPDGLLCLQYFEDNQLHYVRQFLIVGSSDGVAKVWDPDTHSCVGMLEGHADRLNALCWLPKHELLVTGSLDGTVQIWKPSGFTYRLENTVGLNLGAVNALGYIEESKRVVVGSEQGLATVGIYTSYEEKDAKSARNRHAAKHDLDKEIVHDYFFTHTLVKNPWSLMRLNP